MNKFLSSRLKLYNDLLGKYDSIDKEFPSTVILLNKLKTIVVLYNTNKVDNSSFGVFIDKEFLTYKRVGLCYLKNCKLKTTNFILTLRGIFLYFYLELFLHSCFYTKNSLLKKNCTTFTYISQQNSYNYFLPSGFMFNSGMYSFSNKSFFISYFFKYLNDDNLTDQLNYYFIPIFTKQK